MKVRFTDPEGLDQRTRQGSDALRQGAKYTVLEIFCQADGPNYFRVEFVEGELPSLFDSRLFEIIDPEFHPSWKFSLEWDGSMTIGPAAWSVPGFWEEFMDHGGWASEIYRVERDRILNSQ